MTVHGELIQTFLAQEQPPSLLRVTAPTKGCEVDSFLRYIEDKEAYQSYRPGGWYVEDTKLKRKTMKLRAVVEAQRVNYIPTQGDTYGACCGVSCIPPDVKFTNDGPPSSLNRRAGVLMLRVGAFPHSKPLGLGNLHYYSEAEEPMPELIKPTTLDVEYHKALYYGSFRPSLDPEVQVLRGFGSAYHNTTSRDWAKSDAFLVLRPDQYNKEDVIKPVLLNGFVPLVCWTNPNTKRVLILFGRKATQ